MRAWLGTSEPSSSRRTLRSQALLGAKEAYDLLLLGQSKEATERFQRIKDTVAQNKSFFDSNFFSVVREYLAISYLRMGEQDNCVCRHGRDSCLFPISGSGVHTMTHGSRAAIKEYTEILHDNPKNLTARWLLNVAYMTLGEYPEQVPKSWLLPPELFKSEYDIKRFFDVAPQWGVGAPGLAGGCIIEDFDGDGYLDLMTSSSGLDKDRDQLRYFHNNGDGTFSERTAEAGLTGIIGGKNLIQADYNNDGFTDVLVLRGGGLLGKLGQQPLSLLRNNGDGTFDDVTEEAGLLAFHPTQTAAWVDYDNDGWLDLFVGVESSAVPYFELPLYQDFPMQKEQRCKLYHNNRDGTFTDVASEVGLGVVGYVKGVAWADYNNDACPICVFHRSMGHAFSSKIMGETERASGSSPRLPSSSPPRARCAGSGITTTTAGWTYLFPGILQPVVLTLRVRWLPVTWACRSRRNCRACIETIEA
jgi:FG-GAP-like repeat